MSCEGVTNSWPRVTKSCARDNLVVRTSYLTLYSNTRFNQKKFGSPHELLSHVHDIIKWCVRVTMSCARVTKSWRRVTKSWERDNEPIRLIYRYI
jgi:hypothetical protein